MSNMNFLIADVILFVSGTMTTFSQGDGTKIKPKQFSEFGSRTIKWPKHFYITFGCHAQGKQRLLNPKLLVVLSAGPISHESIQLLTITIDLVALSCFTVCFLWALSLEDQFLSILKFCSVFWGHGV